MDLRGDLMYFNKYFQLSLEASEPDVDDNIYIFSPLNITSTCKY